jgi:hypothetical protein
MKLLLNFVHAFSASYSKKFCVDKCEQINRSIKLFYSLNRMTTPIFVHIQYKQGCTEHTFKLLTEMIMNDI